MSFTEPLERAYHLSSLDSKPSIAEVEQCIEDVRAAYPDTDCRIAHIQGQFAIHDLQSKLHILKQEEARGCAASR